MYAPVGGGLMLVCQLAVSLPCTLIVLHSMAASAARRRHPKYWFALLCEAQPIPLAFLLREMGQFSPYFDWVWLGSMVLLPVGFIMLAVWPGPSGSP